MRRSKRVRSSAPKQVCRCSSSWPPPTLAPSEISEGPHVGGCFAHLHHVLRSLEPKRHINMRESSPVKALRDQHIPHGLEQRKNWPKFSLQFVARASQARTVWSPCSFSSANQCFVFVGCLLVGFFLGLLAPSDWVLFFRSEGNDTHPRTRLHPLRRVVTEQVCFFGVVPLKLGLLRVLTTMDFRDSPRATCWTFGMVRARRR